MKNKNLWLVAITFLAFSTTVGLGLVQWRGSSDDLRLTLKASKDTFMLGERIFLTAELHNFSGNEVVLLNTFDPVYGSLKIYSQNGRESVEYMNPKWGILEVPNGTIKIKANESITNDFQILTRLELDYIAKFFYTVAGTYYVKISYHVRPQGQQKTTIIESEPIKIKIVEPQGEDLEVWNKIKKNGEIAYFIHHGDFYFPLYKTEEREKLRQQIEQIIDQHPNSFYAESLRQSLAKFRESEAKRTEAMRKLQKSQEN